MQELNMYHDTDDVLCADVEVDRLLQVEKGFLVLLGHA
jgi:hypothetical protein